MVDVTLLHSLTFSSISASCQANPCVHCRAATILTSRRMSRKIAPCTRPTQPPTVLPRVAAVRAYACPSATLRLPALARTGPGYARDKEQTPVWRAIDMCRQDVSEYAAIFAANYSASDMLPQCQKCC